MQRFVWRRALGRLGPKLARAIQRIFHSNARLIKNISPRTLISRLGIITTCITALVPPIIYAVVSTHQLKERAAEQAAVGALFFAVELAREGAIDGLTQTSSSVLHASNQATEVVTASWLTDKDDTVVMFAGDRARWPELRARKPIQSAGFEGYFNVAVSTRDVFVGTFYALAGFLLLGLAAYYCFRRLPLAALDDALHLLDAKQEALLSQKSELETQNLRLDAALENMSQGLCMFDSEQRLVICNKLYAVLYGLEPEQVRPGTTLRQLLEYRHEKGVFGNVDFEMFVGNWLAEFSKASSRIQELADGRVLSIVRRPMPDGGLVSTTADITEREKLKATLVWQNEQLDAALNNMSHGLAMFDAEQRLVMSNKLYAEMYGLTPEQVKPGTTVGQIFEYRLANGSYNVQDKKFVNLWVDDLDKKGSRIQGPAESRIHELADGRVISISVQQMTNDGLVVTHQDITEQRRMEERISHIAHHDALTGLPNRVLLRKRLEQALSGRRRTEGVAVLCLDLDHFKEVNDTLGHPVGDALLKSIAERLRGCAQESDTIARASGDEFVIVQISSDPPKEATALAARIIEVLSAPYDLDGHQVVVGASIGIAIAPNDGTDADALLKHADLALYRTKGEGRGTYRFFEQQMNTRMQERRALEVDLRKALANGEFELYYQPVVNLERGDISGLEALLRWNHPNRGRVSPAEFIGLAEETGLIVPIGEWALRQACADATSWPAHIRVAVNVSAVQFKNRNLLGIVFNALATSGLAAGRLELEITESVLIQDGEAALATLIQLRDLGVRIALDDFGTGYSSLSYLRSFPFDKIKIDGCFVRDLSEADDEALAIVRAVAGLGTSLGIATTAEGVETEEQLKRARAEGCTEMQGYLFSPPRAAAEIKRLFFSQTSQSADAA
jgi:diguanylate cyclase (GGDEF)-like protein